MRENLTPLDTLRVTRSVRRSMKKFYTFSKLYFVLHSKDLGRLTDCFILEHDDDKYKFINLAYFERFPCTEKFNEFFPTTKTPEHYFRDSSNIPFDIDNFDHLLSFYCRVLFKNGFYALVDNDGYDKMLRNPFISLKIVYENYDDLNSTPQIDETQVVPLFVHEKCDRCQSSGKITLSDGVIVWCPNCCEKTKDVITALINSHGGIEKTLELLHASQKPYPWDIYLFDNLPVPDTKKLQVSLLPIKCASLGENKASFVLLREIFDSKKLHSVGSIKAIVTLQVRTFNDVRYTLHIDYCDKNDDTFAHALTCLKRSIKNQKNAHRAEYFQLAEFLIYRLGFLPLAEPLPLAEIDQQMFHLVLTQEFENDDESKYQVEPVHSVKIELWKSPDNDKKRPILAPIEKEPTTKKPKI